MQNRHEVCAVAALVVALLISPVGQTRVGATEASAGVNAGPPAAPSQPGRTPFAKRTHTHLQVGDSRTLVDVKFTDGTDIRLRHGRLVAARTGLAVPAVEAVLAKFPHARVTRLFESTSEQGLDASRQEAIDASGTSPADLNLFFRIQLARSESPTALVDQLNAVAIVENAAPEPVPTPSPATPNFQSKQGYRTAASSDGVDADYAQTLVGGRGEYVRIADVEYSWNRSHEDLSKARVAGSSIANGTACDPFSDTNHGTAVLGEMVGDANGTGVTGVAPGATLLTVNASRLSAGQCVYALADAINTAANHLAAGDVMIIEQQAAGPRSTATGGQLGDVPVEWDQTGAVWSAIQSATARGVVVIEPAGNGSQNLNDPIYNNASGHNWFSYDSGAIIVGAGNAAGCTYGSDPTIARGRLSFSNYGSRLNVQGWGSCVTTTGYGDLQGGSVNAWYTRQFSGTSSASPIVASSAAVLSSVAKARGVTLTPAQIRATLASTGQAQQFGNTGNIGPLPNLRAAIATLGAATGPSIAEAGHTVDASPIGGGVPVVERWSTTAGAPATYAVWLSTDGGAWVQRSLANASVSGAVFALAPNHNYRFAAHAANSGGTWGPWAYGSTFNLGEYQENYSANDPSYTGTWTRAAYSPAAGGYVDVSATTGSTAKFTFTGSSVAWVATRSTNRGSAYVYLDGVYSQTVSLYSTTTIPEAVMFVATWNSVGAHSITIRVVGTSGHPKVDVDAFVRLR